MSGTPSDEEQEYDERPYDCKDELSRRKRDHGRLSEDCRMNLLGEKDDLPVHFCDKCDFPIKIYGRVIPCKHAFCHECATSYEDHRGKICPGCRNPVLRIEEYARGSIFMCSTVQGCKRTYLSQRDLRAHINHRHKVAGNRATHTKVRPHRASLPSKNFMKSKQRRHKDLARHVPFENHTVMPLPPVQHTPNKYYYNQPYEDTEASRAQLYTYPYQLANQKAIRISSVSYNNLIVVPIEDGSNSAPAQAPAHHQLEYQSQPVVRHSYPFRYPRQYYTPFLYAPSPGTYTMPYQETYPMSYQRMYPMSYYPQDSGTNHLVYNQNPLLPIMYGQSSVSTPYQYMNTQAVSPYMHFLGASQSKNCAPFGTEFPLYYYNNVYPS